jgi:DNA repair protein RecN (Recombination protein N)
VVEGDGPADDVRFLLAANPGGAPQPIAKVASGGELSRATLALRLELTAGPPSLVFDEVDAGIGGETAWAVASLAGRAGRTPPDPRGHPPAPGRRLRRPPAARGQGRARRSTVGHRRGTGRRRRIEELARMLSGQPDSEVGREHAVELLAAAPEARGQHDPARHRVRSARRCPGWRASTAAPRTSSSAATPGDIAIIDHEDLDRVAAETLVAARGRPR